MSINTSLVISVFLSCFLIAEEEENCVDENMNGIVTLLNIVEYSE